ncbi:MAG: CaiB/BaiF CoA transferase family protein [Tepidiformaceae bacterium]
MALALEGVRVLDNGIVQAGTFPARLLADFGAEVVRVENYARPDMSRNAVFPGGSAGDPYWEGGGIYHEQHRNKTLCIGLDVRNPEGREAFMQLVEKSDIVLDSHPPGVMDKLKLDYAALKERKPDVIYVSTSGYGYHGPFATVRSYGMMTEIMCGSGWLNGYPGEEPRRGACPLTDHPSTFHGAFMMMAALIRRKKTGEGCWIDMSQYEIATNVLGDAHVAHAIGAEVPAQLGSVDPGSPFSGVFRCDGFERWIAVSVTSQKGWEGLCALVGMPQLASIPAFETAPDSETQGRLSVAVSAWAATRGTDVAFRELSAAGVAASPVNDVRDLFLDPHLEERGFFWTMQQAPEQHSGKRAWPGPSAQMSVTPPKFNARAPMLGEHNREVATRMLGYSPAEFEAMEASGAFGTIPAAAAMKPPPSDLSVRTALSSSAYGWAKQVDSEHMDRLRARFGADYGS